MDATEKNCAVVGSQSFRDYDLMCEVLDPIKPTKIYTGNTLGADDLALRYATEHKLPWRVFTPNFKLSRKRAIAQNNADIIENAHKVVAFWDGQSPGTQDTIEKHKLTKKAEDLLIVLFPPPVIVPDYTTYLEFIDVEPGRLLIKGKACFPIKDEIRKIGGRWDSFMRQWVIDGMDDHHKREKTKTKISTLVNGVRLEKQAKRSQSASDAWEVRKKQASEKKKFDLKKAEPKVPDELTITEYSDKKSKETFTLVAGPKKDCDDYVSQFQKQYDHMLYYTSIEELSECKRVLKRWTDARD